MEVKVYKYCENIYNETTGEKQGCKSNVKQCQTKGELPISSGAHGQVYLCDSNDKVLKIVDKYDDLEGEIGYVKYNNTKFKKGEKYKYVAEIFLPFEESVGNAPNYIVMENVVTLDKYVELMNKRITDVKQLFNAKLLLIRKLIEALKFLHLRIGYCHNDLKPQNIGIKKEMIENQSFWMIKFIDMGASVSIKPENRNKMYLIEYGDRLYQPTLMFSYPLILENIQQDYYRDMWAMGCIMYYIVCEKYMIIADFEPQIYKVLMNMDLDSLSYMLCIDEENPDLRKDSANQCINDAMLESRKAFNNVLNVWYDAQTVPFQQISFITTIIFDFMYRSVAQCYEKTDMYEELKQTTQTNGGANSHNNNNFLLSIFEANQGKQDVKELLKSNKPEEAIYKQVHKIVFEHRNKSKKDTRDVDMLRNIVYLKINATKKI